MPQQSTVIFPPPKISGGRALSRTMFLLANPGVIDRFCTNLSFLQNLVSFLDILFRKEWLKRQDFGPTSQGVYSRLLPDYFLFYRSVRAILFVFYQIDFLTHKGHIQKTFRGHRFCLHWHSLPITETEFRPVVLNLGLFSPGGKFTEP